MATVRKTVSAKSKTAVLKTIAELTRSIETIDTKLEEMTAQQAEFLQKNYVSQKVSHKTFGEGVIVEQKEDIIKVSFADSSLTKAFVIHHKFTNRPIFEDDEETIAAFSDYSDRRLSINHMKQERIRLEKQRTELAQA